LSAFHPPSTWPYFPSSSSPAASPSSLFTSSRTLSYLLIPSSSSPQSSLYHLLTFPLFSYYLSYPVSFCFQSLEGAISDCQ
jgi:hypothetical protein